MVDSPLPSYIVFGSFFVEKGGKGHLYTQNGEKKPNAVLAKLALAKTTKTASNTEEQLHAPQATRVTLGYIPLASGTCEATRRNAMCVLGFPLTVQFCHISFPK